MPCPYEKKAYNHVYFQSLPITIENTFSRNFVQNIFDFDRMNFIVKLDFFSNKNYDKKFLQFYIFALDKSWTKQLLVQNCTLWKLEEMFIKDVSHSPGHLLPARIWKTHCQVSYTNFGNSFQTSLKVTLTLPRPPPRYCKKKEKTNGGWLDWHIWGSDWQTLCHKCNQLFHLNAHKVRYKEGTNVGYAFEIDDCFLPLLLPIIHVYNPVEECIICWKLSQKKALQVYLQHFERRRRNKNWKCQISCSINWYEKQNLRLRLFVVRHGDAPKLETQLQCKYNWK